MPEYLAPGVYVEETSFRAKSIEGVSTSTAAFVGPTAFGPTAGVPELVTNFAEFERVYGGLDPLAYGTTEFKNYLAHGVRAFFEEGGSRLYITRVYRQKGSDKGVASAAIKASDAEGAPTVTVSARYPGAVANVPVSFTFKLGPNILRREPLDPTRAGSAIVPVLKGASEFDVVYVTEPGNASSTKAGLYWVQRKFDGQRYTFELKSSAGTTVQLSELDVASADADKPEVEAPFAVRVLTCDVTVGRFGKFGHEQVFANLALHPAHANSLTQVFTATPTARATALYVPLVVTTAITNGAAVAECLMSLESIGGKKAEGETEPPTIADMLEAGKTSAPELTGRVMMSGGSDGERPTSAEFAGEGGTDEAKIGLQALEDVEDISIVAAPGSTYGATGDYKKESSQIQRLLIAHAERMRYRVAVLDAPNAQLVAEVRAYRAQFDSTHAAIYYPWIRVMDPISGQEVSMPPSGFVAGIYARSDVQVGVHKAPANEVVRSAIGLELVLNKAQQDVLNPEGINCFRYFEGRGYRLWGARTISSDPEWKYVNVRRYFAYLERSIDKGTQWAVFMNNHEPLWSKVVTTISDFLYNEWKNERLMGTKPEEAYFVRCDRSTMTQNDLDNGRLICLVGVSPVRPAEFVVFRIGQWTADRKA